MDHVYALQGSGYTLLHGSDLGPPMNMERHSPVRQSSCASIKILPAQVLNLTLVNGCKISKRSRTGLSQLFMTGKNPENTVYNKTLHPLVSYLSTSARFWTKNPRKEGFRHKKREINGR